MAARRVIGRRGEEVTVASEWRRGGAWVLRGVASFDYSREEPNTPHQWCRIRVETPSKVPGSTNSRSNSYTRKKKSSGPGQLPQCTLFFSYNTPASPSITSMQSEFSFSAAAATVVVSSAKQIFLNPRMAFPPATTNRPRAVAPKAKAERSSTLEGGGQQ